MSWTILSRTASSSSCHPIHSGSPHQINLILSWIQVSNISQHHLIMKLIMMIPSELSDMHILPASSPFIMFFPDQHNHHDQIKWFFPHENCFIIKGILLHLSFHESPLHVVCVRRSSIFCVPFMSTRRWWCLMELMYFHGILGEPLELVVRRYGLYQREGITVYYSSWILWLVKKFNDYWLNESSCLLMHQVDPQVFVSLTQDSSTPNPDDREEHDFPSETSENFCNQKTYSNRIILFEILCKKNRIILFE